MKNSADQGGCYPPRPNCRILHILRKPNSIIVLLFLQNNSKYQLLFVELSSCSSCHVFRQYFAVKRVKCSETVPSFCSNYQNNSISSLGFLCQRFNNLQPGCTFDVILTWSFQYDKIFSKFSQQQLVLVNYARDFNQSETGKYFEWIYWRRLSIIWRIMEISEVVIHLGLAAPPRIP